MCKAVVCPRPGVGLWRASSHATKRGSGSGGTLSSRDAISGCCRGGGGGVDGWGRGRGVIGFVKVDKCAASQHICARNDHINVMVRRRKGATTSLGGNIGQIRNVNEIAYIAQNQNSEGFGKEDGTCNVKERYERGITPEGRPREAATPHRPVWRVLTARMKTISKLCL